MTTSGHFANDLLPKLLRARGAAGLSRRQLASLLDVRYIVLGSWERGDRMPAADDARRWADLLRVPWPRSADDWFTRKSAKVQPCPSRAAFLRHVYNGEEVCEECRLENNRYVRDWRRARCR